MNETHRRIPLSHKSYSHAPAPRNLQASRTTNLSFANDSRYIQRKSSAVGTGIIIAASIFTLGKPLAVHARPARAHKTQSLQGTWGWTSGSQTYLRARPSAQTPPVAKVPTHTHLYVWGKFNGWYRVETPDHIFGWVYSSYLEVSNPDKVAELSHYKAKIASDRTGHQAMYGSKELLANYYSKYKAPGAAKGLRKYGVVIAASNAKKPRAGSTSKSTPRMAQTKAKQTRIASTRGITSVSAVSHSARYNRTLLPAVVDPAFNDVGNVHLSPSQPSSSRDSRWDSRYDSVPSRMAARGIDATEIVADSPQVPTSGVEAAFDAIKSTVLKAGAAARATSAHSSKAQIYQARVQAARARQAKMAAFNAKQAAAAKAAAGRRWVLAHQAEQARQQTAAHRRQQMREASWLARVQKTAKQREALRQRMGSGTMATPPVLENVPPLSPDELLRARNAFLAGQGKTNSSATAPIAPSAWDGLGPAQTIPAINFQAKTRPQAAKPAAPKLAGYSKSGAKATKSTPPSRGGSPRDYAAYAMKQHGGKSFGDELAEQAISYRGMPYIYGASSPRSGFDCSGLIFYMLRQRGYKPPRTASELAHYGDGVPAGHLKRGDIVLFANTYKRGVSHVGVYLGDGKFVHAANPSRGVRVDSLFSGYYSSKFYGARRIK